MTEEKIKTSPDVCSYINKDNNKLHLEIAIPGVKKENINQRSSKLCRNNTLVSLKCAFSDLFEHCELRQGMLPHEQDSSGDRFSGPNVF